MKAIALLMMLTAGASVALAQNAAEERDPFYPSGNRPSAPAPSSDADWGRDPFTNPLGGKTTARQAPGARSEGRGLTGIIYSRQARVAIIGGEVLREGSIAGGKRLVDIRRKSVVLMDEAGKYEELFLEDFSIGR